MKASLVSQADPVSFNFNVAHVATIQANLLELASRLDFSVGQEVDDLEEYDVAYLQLSEEFYFYLSKYKSRPPGETEVFFASRLNDWEVRLEEICAALDISSSGLLWKNMAYMKTPERTRVETVSDNSRNDGLFSSLPHRSS